MMNNDFLYLWLSAEVRLRLRKTQINLVFRSACTNFVPK